MVAAVVNATTTRALAALGVAVFAVVLARTAWIERDAYRAFHAMQQSATDAQAESRALEDTAFGAHPLWNLMIGGVIRVTGEIFFSPIAAAMLLSIAAVAILLFLLAPNTAALILAAFALVCSSAFVDFATSGLPYPLVYLFLALFLWVYFKDTTTPERTLGLALLAAMLALVQLDTLFITVPALLWTLYAQRSWQAAMLAIAGMLPLLLWLALYLALAQSNPAQEDAAVLVFDPAQGFWYAVYTLRRDPITLGVLAAGCAAAFVLRDGRGRALSAGILCALLFVLLTGGSAMAGSRFAPLFLVALALITRVPWLQRPPAFGAALIAIGLLGYFNANPPLASATIFGENPAKPDHGIRDEREHTFQFRSLYQWRRGAIMPLNNTAPKNTPPPRKPKVLPPPDQIEKQAPLKGLPKLKSGLKQEGKKSKSNRTKRKRNRRAQP